jgi:putative ABC transport system permease protein
MTPDPGAPRAPDRPAWRRYLQFWGRPKPGDIDDEFRFHAEMRAEHYATRGMPRTEAWQAAMQRLGNIDLARAECITIVNRRNRTMDRRHLIDTLWQDVSFALRTLLRQKAWTAIAVLTIALGIGANTAVFSAVNALILHPLAFRDADRIVTIYLTNTAFRFSLAPTLEQIELWRREARSFDGIEMFAGGTTTLNGHGDPRTIRTGMLGSGFEKFAGVPMILGRGFTTDETTESGAKVVVLSEHFWRGALGGDRSILGTLLDLDGVRRTVVGVAPDGLRLPSLWEIRVDVFLPFAGPANGPASASARLKRGVTIVAAQRELDSLVVRAKLNPLVSGMTMSAKLVPLGQGVWYRAPLLTLMGAVAILLLIACANVAHLLLVRGAARARELAIRRALGAGRGRIARQLLTESLILALVGCIVGLGLGTLGMRGLIALRPSNLTQLGDIHLDRVVLTVTLLISLATGLVFGMVGATAAIRRDAGETLKANARATTGTARGSRSRALLVIAEMALSAMLLVGALMLIRTFSNLVRLDPGFQAAGLYAMKFDLSGARYPSEGSRALIAEQLLARARAIPGVTAATLASSAPPNAGIGFGNWEAEGGSGALTSSGLTASNKVAPEYFSVLGQRLIDGRAFEPSGSTRSLLVADPVIISQALAKALFHGERAVGRHIRIHSDRTTGKDSSTWQTVIGVAADAAVMGLGNSLTQYAAYFPTKTATTFGGPTLIVRVTSGANPFPALRRLSLQLDPSLPPPEAKSIASDLRDTVSMQRFTMTLLSIFAGLAMMLSAIGLYGVISFVIGQRTREIGIRVALGASRGHVVRISSAYAATLCGIGLTLGLIGAQLAATAMRKTLYGVQPSDPVSFVAGSVALAVVAALACLIPVRRALLVDPAITMRAE